MQVIDKEALDNFIQGDQELLTDLAIMFKQFMPDTASRLRLAVNDHDAPALREMAHQLKSRLGYFAAGTLQDLAAELETCGRDNELHNTEPLLDQLLAGCHELLAELSTYTGLSLAVDDD